MTAGVLLFVVRRERRGAYQTLFRDRRVHKTYEAVAPYDPAVTFPRAVRSRIVKERGVILAREVAGAPNAETRVELLEHRERIGKSLRRAGNIGHGSITGCEGLWKTALKQASI